MRAIFFYGLTALVIGVHAPAKAQDEKRSFTDAELATMPAPGPNPFLSYLPVEAEVDWDYWHAWRDYTSRLRAEERARASRGVTVVTEIEPNDSQGGAQVLSTFGTGDGDVNEIQVAGDIATGPTPGSFTIGAEDDGAIPLATTVSINSGEILSASGTIGDGPHGSSGTGSADFDFFALPGLLEGDVISFEVDTANPSADLDPNTAIWDSAGNLLAFNEDINPAAGDYDSRLSFTTPADGTYFLSIGGWKGGGQSAVLPGDPFDSSSGTGAASEGSYTVLIGLNTLDVDCYGLNLEPGDMLGADGQGAATALELLLPDGSLQMGSTGSGAGLYPAASPLPGGNVTIDHVTFESGQHAICLTGDPGASYTLNLGAFRHIFEGTTDKQILFVDFDGAEIDTSIFGGPGVRTLSPLSAFLANWGLAPSDEDAVIDAILASMEETITQDLAAQGNSAFDVEIRNSRDHADTFGVDPNVSRLIVGGTIAESGIQTIGIAQSIDPGNFEAGESALTLLDLLSADASNPNSLNRFPVDASSDIIELVGTGVGNITAHEAGHFLGNWHTENSTAGTGPSIMDRGGNLAGSVGVGQDGIFGSGDDIDVDFTIDLFSFAEGFIGNEHTNEKTAFGLTSGDGVVVDGVFEDRFEEPN